LPTYAVSCVTTWQPFSECSTLREAFHVTQRSRLFYAGERRDLGTLAVRPKSDGGYELDPER